MEVSLSRINFPIESPAGHAQPKCGLGSFGFNWRCNVAPLDSHQEDNQVNNQLDAL